MNTQGKSTKGAHKVLDFYNEQALVNGLVKVYQVSSIRSYLEVIRSVVLDTLFIATGTFTTR